MQKKSFNTPDETKTFPNTKVEIVNVAGASLMRYTYGPGWKWTKDVGPVAGSSSCQMHHVLCIVSGQLKVAMDDGSELEIGAGDVADIPPGHDAWVVGNSPVVAIDAGSVVYPKAV